MILAVLGATRNHLSSRIWTAGLYIFADLVNAVFEVQPYLCASFKLLAEEEKCVTLMKTISPLHVTRCQLESKFSWPRAHCYSRDGSAAPAALLVFALSPVLMHCSSVSIHGTSTKDLIFGEESDFYQFSCFHILSSCRKTTASESSAQAELDTGWWVACSSGHAWPLGTEEQPELPHPHPEPSVLSETTWFRYVL